MNGHTFRICSFLSGLILPENDPVCQAQSRETPYTHQIPEGAIICTCKPIATGELTMAKKRAKPTQHSAVQRELRTPKYQMRVVEDKRKYSRNRDKSVRMEDFRKAA